MIRTHVPWPYGIFTCADLQQNKASKGMLAGKYFESIDDLVGTITNLIDSGQIRPGQTDEIHHTLNDQPRQYMSVTPDLFASRHNYKFVPCLIFGMFFLESVRFFIVLTMHAQKELFWLQHTWFHDQWHLHVLKILNFPPL